MKRRKDTVNPASVPAYFSLPEESSLGISLKISPFTLFVPKLKCLKCHKVAPNPSLNWKGGQCCSKYVEVMHLKLKWEVEPNIFDNNMFYAAPLVQTQQVPL